MTLYERIKNAIKNVERLQEKLYEEIPAIKENSRYVEISVFVKNGYSFSCQDVIDILSAIMKEKIVVAFWHYDTDQHITITCMERDDVD